MQEVSPPIKLQSNLGQGLEIQLPQRIVQIGFRSCQKVGCTLSTVSQYRKGDIYGEPQSVGEYRTPGNCRS